MRGNELAGAKLALFLSSIIIYKTVRFTPEKYFDILKQLINNYSIIKDIRYGLEDKMIAEYE